MPQCARSQELMASLPAGRPVPWHRAAAGFIAALASTGFIPSASAGGDFRERAAVSVEGLEADGAAAPLGTDNPTPRLGWRLEASARGVRQTAYQVVVWSSAPEPRRGVAGAPVWDSGKVDSATPWADYGGSELASRTRYSWTVRVWDQVGRPTAWADPVWFETAFMSPAEWRGQWIAGPERRTTRLTPAEGAADDASIRAAGEFCRPPQWPTAPIISLITRIPNDQGECREIRPAPMLRRSFQVSKRVAWARVYSSGLGYHDLKVNGRPASDRVLDPVFTDYSKTVRYTALDVTRLLRRGENVIASELGSGKYDDATRTWDWGWDMAQWRATPRLRLDLYIRYADGSEQVVASDDSWRVSVEGPTRFDGYHIGETYDARREIPGWSEPGFDDGEWAPARIVSAPEGVLRAETSEPSRLVDTRPPGTVTDPAPGIRVYDVGQNLSGWARLRVRAPAGTPVQIYYGEQLTDDGRVTDKGNNFLVGGQLQTDFYVARGAGEEVWSPRFTYKGFQYVQLSGPDGAPLPEGVSASLDRIEQVRTGLAATSTFASGSALLDRIHEATAWSIQNNMQSGVITDTPVYEKNPWTGDAQLSSGSASTMFDTQLLYGKLSQDMVDEQTEQGEVPLLCPSNVNYGYVGKPAFKPPNCCGATPGWDAFWFVLPWETYRRYGDERPLAKVYPAMQRYLDDWIPQWTDKDGDSFAFTLTSGLGDWDPPTGTETVIGLASTAYYAHFAWIAADAARVLGKPADAARYDALFDRIRDDFNAKYLSTDGIYRDTPTSPFTQTAQILPLAFGLVPEELRQPLLAALAENIVAATGGNEYVGILGARYLLPLLTEGGYPDVAFQVATQTDYPSYGYWRDVIGWTALGEFWEPSSRSIDHHMFGSIGQWMYEDLVGVRPLEPGYAAIAFEPGIPAGLDRAAATYQSVRGRVAAGWQMVGGGVEIDLTVPPNATGVVFVPAADPALVTETGSGRSLPADRAPAVELVGVQGDRIVYQVGSGTYRFRIAAAASEAH